MRPKKMEMESRWWTLGGAEVLDVMGTVRALLRQGQVVHIGTDAQKSASRMEFVTVACVLNPREGAGASSTRVATTARTSRSSRSSRRRPGSPSTWR